MFFFDSLPSPLGELYMVFSGEFLSGIMLKKPRMKAGKAPAAFKDELEAYFRGDIRGFNQETVFTSGTEFEKQVWLALKDVPYGETRSYKWLAQRIGSPKSPRAVGQALSKNPIPIVLPCHRIIESDGSIGGYSSGVEIKNRLLKMEYYYSINAEIAE
jgi:methylated-DNA-[protein]-cysteine S-methyltransferase